MSKAHQNSIVPAQDIIQAADDNTVEIFHYDISPNGINGTYPIDDLYDDSLICWLEMQNQNNAGTYIVDKSRYGIHGRINGPTSTNGINGKALSFDGSNDTVEFGNVLNMGTKDMSICMWVKTTNATNEMWIISKSYAGAQNCRYAVGIMSGKARVFMQGNGGGDVVFSGTTTVSDDKWHHLVFTFDRDVAARTYVDGVQDGGSVISQWSSVDMISPNPFRIGAYNNTDGNPMAFFTGQLDEVRVYNKALSTDEISNLYNRSVHTLRSDGKYGGAVAVEESTINRFNPKANWTLQSGMSSYWQLEKLDDYTVKVTALVDSPSVSTYNDIANGSTSYTVGANVTVTYSCEIVDRSNSTIYPSTGGWGPIEGYGTSGDRIYRTITHTAAWTHSMTIRVNTPASVKAGDYLIFRNIQLEEKSFATSFIDGARTSGKLLYPPLSNPCTVSFWVKSFGESGEGSEGSQPLIAINDTAFWLGRAAANDKIMFWCRSTSGTQAYTIDSAIIMNHGTWYHIALTVSSSVVALYINGSFIGSFNDLDNASIVDKRIYMGCESVHGRIGNILIDELRIDKAVRTADEIRSWYLSNVPFYPRGNERVVL